MAQLELFDDVYYNYVGIDERLSPDFTDIPNSEFLTNLENNSLQSLNWTNYTKLLANFDNSTNGSNFNGSFTTIDHFDIYKRTSKENVLHKVYSTTSPEENSQQETIIEDFIIDGYSEYIYVIYPICKIQVSGKDVYTVQNPFEVSIKNDNIDFVSILGLVQDEENPNVYYINEDEIWRFEINLKNDGTELNIDKTFTDTQHCFPKSTGGNRRYNKASVSGLIGKYDCENGYVDSNELIKEWERFAASNCLKLLKDRRGRLMLCDIDSSSITYWEYEGAPAEVSFSIVEIESLDNIEILGRSIPYNTAMAILLQEASGNILSDVASSLLLVSNEG